MIYLKSDYTKTNIFKLLLDFGAHIGDLYSYRHFDHDIFYNILCIRNDYFVFNLEKTVLYLQRTLSFLYQLSYNLGKLLFYHSNIDSYFLKFIFFFLIKYRTLNSFVNTKLKGGYLGNYKKCFLKYLNLLSNIPMKTKSRRYLRKKLSYIKFTSFGKNTLYHRYLFLKLILILKDKTILKRDWLIEFRRLLFFWKSFIFVRTFKSIFQLPDCLISINPSNDWYVLSEYSKTKKCPSIGIIDTSSLYANCTYSIPSNDDSIPLSLFYISIFLNVWLLGYNHKINL